MSSLGQGREARLLRDLDAAISEVAAIAGDIAAALPARPSARSPTRAMGALVRLGPAVDRLSDAAAAVRRRIGKEPRRRELAIARETARALAATVAAVEAALAHPPVPLDETLPPESPLTRREAVLSRAYHALEQAINGPQHESLRAASFPFIPMPPAMFTGFLQVAWRLLAAQGRCTRPRYLEIGAGIGSKLYIARQFFPEAEGMELDPAYLSRAAEMALTAHRPVRVFEGDALAFDRYGDYDVIYSYVPVRDVALQNRLEQAILDGARDGTVILAPRIRASVIQAREAAVPHVFVQGHAGERLAALRAEAMRVGPLVPPVPRRRDRIQRHNLLNPVIDALRLAGFGLPSELRWSDAALPSA